MREPNTPSEANGTPKTWRLSNPYFIIACLLVVIVVGGLYVYLSRPGGETVEVVSFTPTGEVPQGTNFTIEFSKTLAPDSLLDRTLDNRLVEFTPPLPAKFRWIEPNMLRVYPDVELAPSTQYTARVTNRVTSEAGYDLQGQREFVFQTQRFRVNSAHLSVDLGAQAANRVKLTATVEFNYEVTPQEAIKYISLNHENGPAIPYKLVTQTSGRIINLEAGPVERGEEDKKINLKVALGLACIGGNLPLEREFVEPLTLPGQQDLKLVRMMPKKRGREKGYIEIEFNMPVNLQSAKQNIEIQPPIDFNVATTHHYVRLRGDFQMGSSYQIFLRKGLLAVDGSPLEKDISSAVSFRKEQIPPQTSFVGEGFYLTRDGNLKVGLSTINVDKVAFEIEKVFTNNVVFLLNSNDLTSRYSYINLPAMGRKIGDSEIVVQNRENEEIITPIDIHEYLAVERNGIFRLTARMSTQRWRQATKWVLATNMGLVTKKSGDDLWVWVNALDDLAPLANAKIQLISQNNQTLVSARTDEDGIAIIQNYTRFTDEFVPYVITATAGDDFSFLELQRRRVPTSDFDVGGSTYLQHGYEAFVYNERGVYRPGESAHLAAIVRGENASLPAAFPVNLQVTGPDNRILIEKRASLNEEGAAEFEIVIPDYARTGKYRASLRVGDKKEIGFANFNVEDFIPDRMKVQIKTDKASYATGESVQIDVEAVTLFGPPAAGRRVQAQVEIEQALFSPVAWHSFTFRDASKKFNKIKTDLQEQKLDAAGTFRYSYTVPANLKPPSSLRGILSTTVLEPGGRGVSAYRAIEIHPYQSYVGLRKAQEGYAEPGAETKIEYVVADPAGQSVAGHAVEISFYKITWHSILKRVDSQRGYRYVSERVEDLIRKFDVTSGPGASSFTVRPEDYGSYKIVARDKISGASSSLTFYASGWGYAPWAMDHPDRIEIDLDKKLYSPGENAEIQVRAPFSGKLLLTIERDKILDRKVIKLAENTATIKMPVRAAYKPNVYVSAHLIRSTDGLERDEPVRAFGVVPLFVNTDEQKLTLEVKAPSEVKPNEDMEIELRAKGQKGHRPYLTIAVVDEGICQLTDFATPDPHGFFFGKKRLSVVSYDIYGVVLPEISSSSLTATGGDVEAARKRQLTPVSVTRVKPVAFWSGLVKTDRKGRSKVTFKMPQFNGSVRIMAVAFAGDRFGNAQQNVFVREPIVLTPTFPRFISSTDKFRVPVNLYNGTGKDAVFDITLESGGPLKIIGGKNRKISVAKEKEKQAYFEVEAEEAIGKVTFRLSASGNGKHSSMSVDVPLRPPVPFVTLAGYGAVEQGSPQSFTFPADWLAETVDFKLTLSSFPAVKFAGSLQYLLRYPYGCIEQTTSKVFPLLAFDDLARLVEPELFKRNSADYFIQEGISRLENMQLVSGAFSYWPSSGYINNWSSVYASHFLVEARKAGYVVSDRVYNRLLNALAATTRDYSARDSYKNQTAVYACYVLALAGKPDKSTMLYLKNNVLDQLTQYSKFQLAGAFAFSGDLQTARSLLPNTVTPVAETKRRETGRNFNSSIRAQAIMLEILAEVDPKHAMVPVLVRNLSDAASKAGRWYTTQENAYAFLALGKILRNKPAENYTGTVSIDGKVNAKFSTDEQEYSGKDWAGKKATIAIDGQGTCYYYWQAEGIPSTLAVAEFDRDLQVRRRYLDKNGNPIHYDQFTQGDMVIAEISVKALSENLENVAIVDMLPAGFEIENPRLQSRQGVAWIGEKAYRPAYMDIRDDRMIIFGNFRIGRTDKFYYGLRAVTAGEFILPPVRAEAMYAPQKASVASSGRVVISAL